MWPILLSFLNVDLLQVPFLKIATVWPQHVTTARTILENVSPTAVSFAVLPRNRSFYYDIVPGDDSVSVSTVSIRIENTKPNR